MIDSRDAALARMRGLAACAALARMRGLAACAALALVVSHAVAPAHATNGYIANGFGTISKGMAGAGVAVDAGVVGLSQNPAMGIRVGNQAGACFSAFSPDRSVTISGTGGLTNGEFDSDNNLFLIPCAGVNFLLDENSALGLTFTANGGMNTEYGANPFVPGFGPFGTTPLGVDLVQGVVALNYALRVTPALTLGVGPTLAIQRFEGKGLENFAGFSTDPASVSNNGNDWSVGGGINIGLLWEPSAQWQVGIAYRSRVYMRRFEDYQGLFAEQGDFDIPATFKAGVAFTPASNPDLTLTAEYEHIFYGSIDSIANTGVLPPASFQLGANNGAGFGWQDMDIFRLAAIWRANDQWTLRGGVSHASDFIDNDEVVFNIIAPGTPKWHLSLGATYEVNASWRVSGALTHAINQSFTGTNPFLTPNQPVKLEMNQTEFSMGMTYSW
jgi:long-chain fatty acid transport protein